MATTGPILNLAASAAIDQYRLLRHNSSGQWALCGVGQVPHAAAMEDVASGQILPGLLLRSGTTAEVNLSGTCTRGDLLYAAASGRVSTTAVNSAIGVAMSTVSSNASNDAIIEMLPLPAGATGTFVLQGTASGSGTIDLTHSLGANPRVAGLLVRTAAGAVRQVITASTCTITFPDTSTVRVAHTDIVSTDIVSIIAMPQN